MRAMHMQLSIWWVINIAFIYQMIHCTVNIIWKHSVFAYPKREHYCFNRFYLEMARQMTLSIELSWQPELARYSKTEPIYYWYSIVLFWDKRKCFQMVLTVYHLVDERGIHMGYKTQRKFKQLF
jgi:hypothetical protein